MGESRERSLVNQGNLQPEAALASRLFLRIDDQSYSDDVPELSEWFLLCKRVAVKMSGPLPGLASDLVRKNKRGGGGKTASFPILQTNSYGRTMIKKQMHTHDHLIEKTSTRTDSWISKVKLALR